ncbi:hypothetical protein [Streptomyces sp. NPDC048637]|uniref:hypothetical protein n=1 Tax=Streptomyces sp. NPDC048637 TaxID=3155636 RepID=UPI0034439603
MSSVDEKTTKMQTLTAKGEPTKDAPERIGGQTGNTRGHGQFWAGVTDGRITKDSAVTVAITEIGLSGPVMAQARMQVSNVVPRNGGVDVWCNIDAPSDRTFRLLYVIG